MVPFWNFAIPALISAAGGLIGSAMAPDPAKSASTGGEKKTQPGLNQHTPIAWNRKAPMAGAMANKPEEPAAQPRIPTLAPPQPQAMPAEMAQNDPFGIMLRM